MVVDQREGTVPSPISTPRTRPSAARPFRPPARPGPRQQRRNGGTPARRCPAVLLSGRSRRRSSPVDCPGRTSVARRNDLSRSGSAASACAPGRLGQDGRRRSRSADRIGVAASRASAHAAAGSRARTPPAPGSRRPRPSRRGPGDRAPGSASCAARSSCPALYAARAAPTRRLARSARSPLSSAARSSARVAAAGPPGRTRARRRVRAPRRRRCRCHRPGSRFQARRSAFRGSVNDAARAAWTATRRATWRPGRPLPGSTDAGRRSRRGHPDQATVLGRVDTEAPGPDWRRGRERRELRGLVRGRDQQRQPGVLREYVTCRWKCSSNRPAPAAGRPERETWSWCRWRRAPGWPGRSPGPRVRARPPRAAVAYVGQQAGGIGPVQALEGDVVHPGRAERPATVARHEDDRDRSICSRLRRTSARRSTSGRPLRVVDQAQQRSPRPDRKAGSRSPPPPPAARPPPYRYRNGPQRLTLRRRRVEPIGERASST